MKEQEKGAHCNPATGKSPNEYRGDVDAAAAVFSLPTPLADSLSLSLSHSLADCPSLSTFISHVCVVFSFCKFVLLVPFGFISASFVLQHANFNGEWQKQVSPQAQQAPPHLTPVSHPIIWCR